MASEGIKTDMIRCVVEAEQITFEYVVRMGEEWQVKQALVMDCNAVPDRLEDGEGFASMKAYGIRAFVSDRTSQFRGKANGFTPADTMQAMQEVYEMLCNGVYRAKRKGGSASVSEIDLMAQAIAELKGLPLEQALASVKALPKDKRDLLKGNEAVAAKMAAIKAQVAVAEVVDLEDLF